MSGTTTGCENNRKGSSFSVVLLCNFLYDFFVSKRLIRAFFPAYFAREFSSKDPLAAPLPGLQSVWSRINSVMLFFFFFFTIIPSAKPTLLTTLHPFSFLSSKNISAPPAPLFFLLPYMLRVWKPPALLDL